MIAVAASDQDIPAQLVIRSERHGVVIILSGYPLIIVVSMGVGRKSPDLRRDGFFGLQIQLCQKIAGRTLFCRLAQAAVKVAGHHPGLSRIPL